MLFAKNEEADLQIHRADLQIHIEITKDWKKISQEKNKIGGPIPTLFLTYCNASIIKSMWYYKEKNKCNRSL